MLSTYNDIVKGLTKKKVPCKVKLIEFNTRSEVVIELGNRYPDRIANKVLDIIEDLGFNPNSNVFSICSTQSGGLIKTSTCIAGGTKNY